MSTHEDVLFAGTELQSAATRYGHVPVEEIEAHSALLKLAALEYAAALLTRTFSNLLDEGELERLFVDAATPVLRLARERPERLP